MQIEIDQLLNEVRKSYDKALDHLKNELTKIRAGKASPTMLDGIRVEYYGTPMPLNQVSNITTADAKTIVIQPWEKSMLGPIEKAIFEANLGLTPMNDGEVIRLNIPPLTEDRRQLLVKQAKQHGEETKISLRNTRHKALEIIKKAVKDGYPEDAGKRLEEKVEDLTKDYGKKVDDMIHAKEKDIMTI